MGEVHGTHAVRYLTWANLKGSAISVLIGAAIYLVVVRGLLMKPAADGKRVYVDRWPAWADLETIYSGVIALLVAVGKGIAGVLDILTDTVVILLRKTVYKDSPRVMELEEGNEVTHAFGVFLNCLEDFLNRSIWKNHPRRKDLEHWLVLKYVSLKENTGFIERSLSYGLILFCLGLCGTLIYLLVAALG